MNISDKAEEICKLLNIEFSEADQPIKTVVDILYELTRKVILKADTEQT